MWINVHASERNVKLSNWINDELFINCTQLKALIISNFVCLPACLFPDSPLTQRFFQTTFMLSNNGVRRLQNNVPKWFSSIIKLSEFWDEFSESHYLVCLRTTRSQSQVHYGNIIGILATGMSLVSFSRMVITNCQRESSCKSSLDNLCDETIFPQHSFLN